MSVAELEENEVIEEEFAEVEEVDEEVDNDQTEVEEIVSEDESSDEELSDDNESEVEEDEDGIEISFDGESLSPEDDEEKDAKPWVKELRKEYKDTKKENRELKRKLEENAQANPPAPQVGDPGKKPTLSDYDYESDPYEEALDKWYIADQEFQEVKRNQDNEQKRANEEWRSKLNNFEAQKKKLGLKDFDDAEESVANTLTQTQRGIIVQGSDNPALSFYAIGKNKALATELANITDPVKFAFAVSKMENKLKATKKARTRPETTLKSSGGTSGKDNTLDRLRAEADKTNDRTKVVAYMQKLRQNNK